MAWSIISWSMSLLGRFWRIGMISRISLLSKRSLWTIRRKNCLKIGMYKNGGIRAMSNILIRSWINLFRIRKLLSRTCFKKKRRTLRRRGRRCPSIRISAWMKPRELGKTMESFLSIISSWWVRPSVHTSIKITSCGLTFYPTFKRRWVEMVASSRVSSFKRRLRRAIRLIRSNKVSNLNPRTWRSLQQN